MKTSHFTLPLLLFFTFFLSISAQMTGNFKCNSSTTCRALVGYSSKNVTTLNNIQTLFSIKNLRSILGANNLPLSTPRNQSVNPNQVIKIPIPCSCFNGTGVSDRVPVYTVKPDDSLFFIAAEVFGGLLRYQKIGEMNRIKDDDVIEVGQRFWIPLPCSCDKVNGQDVVHYAHVVKQGSSIGQIANEFGTDNGTLIQINGISGDEQLLADLPLNVPLRACNSSVRNDSLDAPLLLPNSSYALTANNCVRCSCQASSNWTLTCEPSQFDKPVNWQTCPPLQCEGSEALFIGNTTSMGSPCGLRSCAYAGYNNQTVFTTLSPDSTCPAAGPGNGSGNHAATFSSNFSFLILLIHLGLLCLRLLW